MSRKCVPVAVLVCALGTSTGGRAANTAPLRLGVAGLTHDHIGGFFTLAAGRKDVEVVGVSEPNRKVVDRVAARFKLPPAIFFATTEEMLDRTKPDALVVYTSTYEHPAVVKAAAARKVSVMMEKPLAVSLAHARAIEADARRAGITVLVNYETTWHRSNHAVWTTVKEKKAVGDIRKMVVHDGHGGPKEIGCSAEFLSWLTDPKLNGAGALFDFGCYGANLMTWLMDGQRPLSVLAVTQQIKPEVYPRVDDEATIVVTYPRAQGIIQASWNWPFDRKDMEVYGRTGYAHTVRKNETRVRLPGQATDELIPAPPLPPHYQDSLSYFAAVVRGQIKPEGLSTLENNLVVTEILDAARRSATTGKTVHLPRGR